MSKETMQDIQTTCAQPITNFFLLHLDLKNYFCYIFFPEKKFISWFGLVVQITPLNTPVT